MSFQKTLLLVLFVWAMFGFGSTAHADALDGIMKAKVIEEQELTKMAPPSATIKRFEDNNTTIAAFISGQVDLIATGNVYSQGLIKKPLPLDALFADTDLGDAAGSEEF